MRGKLVAEKGLLKGLVLHLPEDGEQVLGRDSQNAEIHVEDPKVSRSHMLCKLSPEGYIIENLSSTNPLLVNDERISGPFLLTPSDRLKIGDSFFRYYANADEASPEEQDLLPSSESDEEESQEDFDAFFPTIYEEKEISFSAPVYTGETVKSIEDNEEEEEEKDDEPDVEESDEDQKEQKSKAAKADKSPAAPFELDNRWLLKVLSGPSTGAEYPLDEDHTYLIGSDAETAQIIIHDIAVSRKHARLTLNEDETCTIEDLKSRNGVRIEGQLIKEKTLIKANQVIVLGTSALMLIDKEAKLTTIDTSLEGESNKDTSRKTDKKEKTTPEVKSPSRFAIPRLPSGQMALLSIVLAIFLIVGMGTVSLFKGQDVVLNEVAPEEQIQKITAVYPDIEYSYKGGALFLLGHVTTSVERDQLLHSLNALPFVRQINNNVIIDELVWQETNTILAKNPAWRSVSLQSPEPGKFVMSGYLKQNADYEALFDYMNLNFPYLERLSNQVIVEEQLVDEMNVALLESAFNDIFVEVSNGELSLSGYMSSAKAPELRRILSEMKTKQGVRTIKNYVVELAPEESMIDLSDRYAVTGHFRHANVNVSVIINGKILARGDALDGMTITSIKPSVIFLEKDGFKFRIDYNK